MPLLSTALTRLGFPRKQSLELAHRAFEMLDPAEMSEAAILEAALRLGARVLAQMEIMRALDRLIARSRSFRLHALLLVRGVLGE